MFSRYLNLLREPGARLFCLGALVGRIPVAAMGLSLVLFIEHATGLYAAGGIVSGCYVLGQAAFSPVISRLIDSYGQRRIALPFIYASVTAMTLLIVLVFVDAPTFLWYLVAAISGGCAPSVGALVRSRWSHILAGDESRITTAFTLEAALDEIIFIVGPIIAVTIATAVWAPGGVIAAGVLQLAGALMFLSRRDTEPIPHRADGQTAAKPGMWHSGIIILILTSLSAGCIFGTVDVSAIALADSQGHGELAGLTLAAFAAGSLIAAIWYERQQFRAELSRRYIAASVLLGGLCSLVLLVQNLVGLAIVLAVVGTGVSPLFIAGNALMRRLVPKARLTEALTLYSISCSVGIALGAAIGGHVIDVHGAKAGFYVTAASGAGLIVIALLGFATLHRDRAPVDA